MQSANGAKHLISLCSLGSKEAHRNAVEVKVIHGRIISLPASMKKPSTALRYQRSRARLRTRFPCSRIDPWFVRSG